MARISVHFPVRPGMELPRAKRSQSWLSLPCEGLLGGCQAHGFRACIIVFIQIHTESLQQIAIKIFSLVYLHFGKLQSNMKGFPRYR